MVATLADQISDACTEDWNLWVTVLFNALSLQVYIAPSNWVPAPSTHAGHVTSSGQPRVTSIQPEDRA